MHEAHQLRPHLGGAPPMPVQTALRVQVTRTLRGKRLMHCESLAPRRETWVKQAPARTCPSWEVNQQIQVLCVHVY